MTTLLRITVLILAPTTAFAQTVAVPASLPQPAVGANPPADRVQDFLHAPVLSAPVQLGGYHVFASPVREGFLGIGVNAGLNIAREFAPALVRLVPFR